MPKIDLATAPRRSGSGYPPPLNEPCKNRVWLELARAAGLELVGINLLTLPAGQWSSQRHWHLDEDEFVFVVSGEVVLVEDGGEAVLRQVGNPTNEATEYVDYPDIDLIIRPGGEGYRHRDGTLY